MLKFTPILLALIYGIVVYRMSVWRTRAALDQQSTELMDPDLTPVVDRLARAVDVTRIKVMIYEIDPVNGLAAPDGRIFITRGFYRRFRDGDVSAEELASVIAHEMGHVALGHTRRRIIDFAGQNAVATALAMVLSRFLPGIGPFVARFLTSLVAARLSRDDEFAADAWASALMIKAGIGTAPQKALFQKLNALTGGGAGGAPEWLLSHPKTEAQIAAIAANELKWGVAGALR
jgi:metalloprotease